MEDSSEGIVKEAPFLHIDRIKACVVKVVSPCNAFLSQ